VARALVSNRCIYYGGSTDGDHHIQQGDSMTRLGIRARAGWRALAMITVAAITATTLGACVPGGDTARSETRELRLYTGEIPEPAPLVANSMGAVEMPAPPTDYSDEQAWTDYEAAVQEYLDALQNSSGDAVSFAQQVSELAEATRNSDEASVAAWQSLLVASGIAVGYGDEAVEVSGMEGAGIPMTMAELRLHALLGASTVRMPLSQLAEIIGAFGVVDETDLTQRLYDDLYDLLATDFGTVFVALDPQVFTAIRYGKPHAVPVDEVTFTGAQVALILRKLSIDLLVLAEQNDGISTAVADTSGVIVPAALRADATDGPCGSGDEEPWAAEGRRNIGKGVGQGFGNVLDNVPGYDGAKLALAAAQAALAIATLLTKMMALKSDFSMGNAPLVRTKDRSAGERRDIAVTLHYPDVTLGDITGCLAALLAPFGFDLASFAGGGAEGLDVELYLKNKRLEYSTARTGTSVYRQKTAKNGMATFPVVGKPQAERLPPGAEPEEVTARVRLDANIEGSDLVNDLKAAAWDAIGPGVVGILSNVVARMKLLSFTWDVPVRDWKLVADFDVVLTGSLWSHDGINRGGVSADHCGTWVTHMSTTAEGTVASQTPTRVTAHYVTEQIEGEVISGLVFYPKGSSLDALVIGEDGGELAHVQADYVATKSEAAPGVEPMPEHYQEPEVSGCGDGDGSYTPPQPDCGSRDYAGIATLLVNDGAVRVLADEPSSDPWKHCGWRLPFADPLSPPSSMDSCPAAQEKGGKVPSPDSVFHESGRFEITGSLTCSRDGQGSLERFTFDWTLTFCRVVEGTSDC
jgi:hypothetical protein